MSWNSDWSVGVVRGSSGLRQLLKLGTHLVLSVYVLSAEFGFNRMVRSGLVGVDEGFLFNRNSKLN